MNIKLIKKNEKVYLELPAQFSTIDEIELFQLKDNFWFICSPLKKILESAQNQNQEKNQEKLVEKKLEKSEKKLSEPEKVVLRELLKIRFADRTPLKIEKLFSQEKQNVVRQLLKKGFVKIFYGKKYQKTGVYNIKDDIYPLINQEEEHASVTPYGEPQTKDAQIQKNMQKSAPQTTPSTAVLPTYSELLRNGWLILSNPRDAEQFSSDLKRIGVAQNIKGVRAFDGKFYIATNKFVHQAYEKIKSVMIGEKTEMHIDEIAAAINFEHEPTLVALNILAENGEISEKKRGLFCLV
ncbi:MAG: hypothetical protein AB1391_00960 [Candidatus Micrarchaeota archaeon]